ncbi:MAG: hypothetical protein ACK56I_04560, partial [bacterium]
RVEQQDADITEVDVPASIEVVDQAATRVRDAVRIHVAFGACVDVATIRHAVGVAVRVPHDQAGGAGIHGALVGVGSPDDRAIRSNGRHIARIDRSLAVPHATRLGPEFRRAGAGGVRTRAHQHA